MINNKKGEMITLSVVVLLVLVGAILYIQEHSEQRNFVIGDITGNVVYDPNSANPDCNIDAIAIDEDNIELFESLEEAQGEGYTLDESCS